MDKTLIKGVNLLQLVVESGRSWSVSSMAKALGIPPSNVHRTLQTWCELGFMTQSDLTSEYHCTLKLFEWGCRVADGFDVRRLAREHLLHLAQISQETIHLSVLEGAEIVYLDKIDSAGQPAESPALPYRPNHFFARKP